MPLAIIVDILYIRENNHIEVFIKHSTVCAVFSFHATRILDRKLNI